MGDLKSFQTRAVALRQAMFADGMRFGLPLHDEDLKSTLARVYSEGASFIRVTLPQFGKALDQGLVSGRLLCPAGFALKRGTLLPKYLHSVISRVWDPETAMLKSDACEDSIQFLRQWFLLDSKLFSEPTVQQRNKAVQGFKDRMANLRKKKIQTDHPALVLAKSIIGIVLRRLDLQLIEPGHGPGSVAEGLDREQRWEFLSWPAKAEREYPYHMYGAVSIRAILERGKGIPLTHRSVTRCCLVPKDFKGPRLISAESAATQFLQQGQMKKIMQYIDKHRLIRRSMRLNDQTFNQKRAERAYAACQATLDLSDASDTISVPLFWYLFSEVPDLRRKLMSTRSDYLRFEDDLIKITAFAPMGSATCFPIESIIFWSLAMATVVMTSSVRVNRSKRNRSGRKPTSDPLLNWRNLRNAAEMVAVFGDDIIVPDHALQPLLGTLQEIGCVPNMSKTCWTTPFRESCGTEWFRDRDVTVVRNRSYQYGALSRRNHPVLCDLQRKFFLHGYYETAETLKGWAIEMWPTPIISVKAISRGIACWSWMEIREQPNLLRTDVNAIERANLPDGKFGGCLSFGPTEIAHKGGFSSKLERFSKTLHRYELRVPQVIQMTRDWEIDGYPRLFARLLGDTSDRIAKRDLRVKLAWSFVPLLPSCDGSQDKEYISDEKYDEFF